MSDGQDEVSSHSVYTTVLLDLPLIFIAKQWRMRLCRPWHGVIVICRWSSQHIGKCCWNSSSHSTVRSAFQCITCNLGDCTRLVKLNYVLTIAYEGRISDNSFIFVNHTCPFRNSMVLQVNPQLPEPANLAGYISLRSVYDDEQWHAPIWWGWGVLCPCWCWDTESFVS